MRSALPAVIIACAATLLLGGCVPQEPVVVPPVEQQSEPVFASDEEALAAATDAYKAYLEMSDLIAQEGGKNPERIAPFVTEEWLEQELLGFRELHEAQRHQEGSGAPTTEELQMLSSDEIGVYYCMDLSHIRVLDVENRDVTPTTRPSSLTLEVRFQIVDLTGSLRVDGIQPWPGAGIC
jgi:hypothetical protein